MAVHTKICQGLNLGWLNSGRWNSADRKLSNVRFILAMLSDLAWHLLKLGSSSRQKTDREKQ